MVASAQDIALLSRLRKIVEHSEEIAQPSTSQKHNVTSGIPIVKTDVDAMAEILQRFHKATDGAAQKLVEDAEYDPRAREALATEQTTSGVKIGKYEVTVELTESSDGKPRKTYNVINSLNREILSQDLALSEAAHCIVRYLNKGIRFDDNKVQAVLDLEETFSRNRIDAVRFKRRYERCVQLNEAKAGNVFADRFQASRSTALAAYEQIKSMLNSIR